LGSAASRGLQYPKAGHLPERDATLQMVLEGGVLRQRFLPDGSRQTVAVYYRDDVINLVGYVGPRTEHTDYLMALEGSVIGEVPDATVQELRAHAPDGMAVLLLHELRIAHERIACLGQRNALERTAHFLCETLLRSAERVGGLGNQCRLALTQEMMSSVLGMTTVHMNRTIRELKHRKLASITRSELVIPDFSALAAIGQFDDAYLIRF
jgi:CRP-like cAMP-binding protein